MHPRPPARSRALDAPLARGARALLRVAATGVATAHFAVRVNIVRVGGTRSRAAQCRRRRRRPAPSRPARAVDGRRRQGGVVGRIRRSRLVGVCFWIACTSPDPRRVRLRAGAPRARRPRHVPRRRRPRERRRAMARERTRGNVWDATVEAVRDRGGARGGDSETRCVDVVDVGGRAGDRRRRGVARERERDARERDANETMMTDRSRVRARSRRRQRAGTGRDRWRCV